MVKKLLELTRIDEESPGIQHSIDTLDRIALHKIESQEIIEAVCHEVISQVEKALLVKINEEELQQRVVKAKGKKKKWQITPEPFIVSEVDTIRDSVEIRTDWSSDQWEIAPPRGWVWQEGGKIISVIYEVNNDQKHRIYIDHAIAANPLGSAILIKNMKAKLKKLISFDATHR